MISNSCTIFWKGAIDMKKKSTILALVICMAGSSTVFARGNIGHHGGYNNGYHFRSNHHGYRGDRHHNDGLGLAVGIVGGLLLSSALLNSPPSPPPRTVVYKMPYPAYQPEVVVRQPRICVEDRIVYGQWQTRKYDGHQVWVSFANPVSRRFQVPCY